jgi:hypothetical protein
MEIMDLNFVIFVKGVLFICAPSAVKLMDFPQSGTAIVDVSLSDKLTPLYNNDRSRALNQQVCVP